MKRVLIAKDKTVYLGRMELLVRDPEEEELFGLPPLEENLGRAFGGQEVIITEDELARFGPEFFTILEDIPEESQRSLTGIAKKKDRMQRAANDRVDAVLEMARR